MADPMHQFEVVRLVELVPGGFDISFTNSAAAMATASAIGGGLMLLAALRGAIVPGRIQAVGEMLYDTVRSMVVDNVGKEGKPYFPFFMTLFVFLLFCNLLGLFPKQFTATSHLSVTVPLALGIFVAVTLIGIFRHGLKFFTLFFPHGAPIFSAPILIPIEIVSYLSRPLSHSVRLFANMVVGHVMLKVIAGFVVSLISAASILSVAGIVAFAVLIPITALEFLVAGLQAYIFTILATVYLHDAIHLH